MATDKTPRNYSGGIPVNIRLSGDLHSEIEHAAEATGLSKQDIIRLSIEAGLIDLKRLDYKLGATISQAAFSLPVSTYPQPGEDEEKLVAEAASEGLSAADRVIAAEAAKRGKAGAKYPKRGK